MTTPKEIQGKFEDKTVGGYSVEILAVKEDKIICAVTIQDESWVVTRTTLEGRYSIGGHPYDLVLKKKNLPKDVLCEVEAGNHWVKRYSDGNGGFHKDGADSYTAKDAMHWDKFKVIENPVRPWFGGECPIPEGCDYRVYFAGVWGKGRGNTSWNNPKLTAYQILGENE